MSILSDYKRHVSDPTEAALRETIAKQRDAIRDLEAENARLSGLLRGVVAHATGGSVVNGDELSLNDISCRITRMRNTVYLAGKDAALSGRAET